MYNPEHFVEVDEDAIFALIDAHPLATLVAMTDAGLTANHIPLLARGNDTLIGHIARANPLHHDLTEGAAVMAIFQGVDGYISPNWYPSKAEHHRHVPTWNYQVVHLHGRIRFSHNEKLKRAIVGQLTKKFERMTNGPEAWRMADAPTDYMDHMLAAIVAFEIDVTRIEAKSKLSQNRETRDLASVAEHLRKEGRENLADAVIQNSKA